MLDIINSLKPFFEDSYIELGVREYSRLTSVSPPTASKLLRNYVSEGILKSRNDRKYLLFRINQDNIVARDLARIYWGNELKELIDYLNKFSPKAIILFGSLAKLENKKDSDIDVVLLGVSNKNLNLEKFEMKLKREIQIFQYPSLAKVNKQLKLNMINGYVLGGYVSWIGMNAN